MYKKQFLVNVPSSKLIEVPTIERVILPKEQEKQAKSLFFELIWELKHCNQMVKIALMLQLELNIIS